MRSSLESAVLVIALTLGVTAAGTLDRSPGIVDDVYHAMTTVCDMYSLGVALEAYYVDAVFAGHFVRKWTIDIP